MNPQTYKFPESLTPSIEQSLSFYNLKLQDSKALAKCILQLSDFFIHNPQAPTPWKETWAQIAYLTYYLPLNSTRLMRILAEADQKDFFKDLTHVIDFGAGLATASLTLADSHNFEYTLIERAEEPQKIISTSFPQMKSAEWMKVFNHNKLTNPQQTLAVFSYSLTELTDLPEWAYDCEALLLIEPSTQQDGRRLLQLRDKLLKKDFHVWAPCTHEGPCPLLTQSKTDWCHDRVHFDMPSWFQKLEEQLPMKNRTLTMSYLLMRKKAPLAVSGARVVGDRLKEKGKDRQLICRGPEREFLAWLHKSKIEQEIPRGVLVQIPEDIPKVSNELRVHRPIERV